MSNELISIGYEDIKNLIYTIRGKQVMLDSDVANLYRYETKYVNLAAKRNNERFPEDFRFQLTEKEFEDLRLQFATLKEKGIKHSRSQIATLNEIGRGQHRKYLPYIDNKELYHRGASIKDLCKKCFGINKIEDKAVIANIVRYCA